MSPGLQEVGVSDAFRGGLLGDAADAKQRWWTGNRGIYTRQRFRARWPLVAVAILLPILVPAIRAIAQGEARQVGVVTLALLVPFCLCYLFFPYVLAETRPLAVRLGFVAGMLALAWL